MRYPAFVLTAGRDDFHPAADPERGELPDALPPHHRPLLLPRKAATRRPTPIPPHFQVEVDCLLRGHPMPVVGYLDRVVVPVRVFGVVPPGKKGTEWELDTDVLRIRVVAIGDQFGHDRTHLVIELDAELIDREAGNAEFVRRV